MEKSLQTHIESQIWRAKSLALYQLMGELSGEISPEIMARIENEAKKYEELYKAKRESLRSQL